MPETTNITIRKYMYVCTYVYCCKYFKILNANALEDFLRKIKNFKFKFKFKFKFCVTIYPYLPFTLGYRSHLCIF